MSTLSISLIVLVVATLAVVAGFNLFQNRGNRPRTAGRAAPAPKDVPVVTERVADDPPGPRGEPTLGLDALVDAAPAAGGGGPTLGLAPDLPPGDAVPAVDVAAPPVPPEGPGHGGAGEARSPAGTDTVALSAATAPGPRAPAAGVLTELADCLVALHLPAPLGGEKLMPMLQPIRRVGAKPVVFEGRPCLDDGTQDAPWSPIVAGTAYDALRGGVLMANRHGPLNAMEYSEFDAAMKALADHLQARATPIDMNRTLERARDLDSVCMQLDAQVGLNVDSPEPLSPADLERLAGAQQLAERGNNRYARLGPRGEVVFSVSLADEPQRLTFLLDVPRSPAHLDPWGQLVACAHAVAARLQGTVVDDGGRTLPDASLARIGQQLQQRYDSLAQAGFAAGSPVALRLFN